MIQRYIILIFGMFIQVAAGTQFIRFEDKYWFDISNLGFWIIQLSIIASLLNVEELEEKAHDTSIQHVV